ncbi:MAG: hypothetical protein ACI33K_07685 [Clostridiaceae bacterium]
MRVLPYILIPTILLMFSVDIFFPGVFYGNLIMKLDKPKLKEKLGKAIMWGLGIMFFSIFFVANIMDYRNKNPYIDSDHYIFQISLAFYWMLYCMLMIFRALKPIEIREKGIFVHDGFFYKFKNISFYTLKSPNIIRITYKNLFKNDKDYELKFRDEEETMKFDLALERYVKRV